MHKRTYDTDEITLRKVYALSTNNQFVPAMNVLTADGAGGTYWAIPSTLGYNPSFNQIATDAGTFTANLPYNTFTLSQGGGIGFVQGAGTNQMYIYSKGFNQINTAGGNTLYGFSNNVTTPALNFAGAGGISLQANPATNTLTFTANGQPISTTLNSFQSLKVFPNLSTPTGQISSLSGYGVLSANNYSSILTLAGTGQISLTSDYNANAVFIGLNASTLVTSNLTTHIVSSASVYTSTLTLLDLVGGYPKNLYSYNGSLFLNGVNINQTGVATVAQIYGGSNIVLTGDTPGLGNVVVNVDTSFLTSTVIGLGTAGYISSVTGVNLNNLVSTANLVNLVSTSYLANQLTTIVSTSYLATQLGSTVVGLGTIGYLSSLNTRSLSTGTLFASSISFIDTLLNTKQLLAVNGGVLQLNGAAITGGGGGSATGDYISTANLVNLVSTSYLASRLGSTVIGLGTAGYLSSVSLTTVNIPNTQGYKWIAVGDGNTCNTYTVQYSLNGTTFNTAASGGFTTGLGNGGHGIAYNGSLWVTTGYSGIAVAQIQTSTDGCNWNNIISASGFGSFGTSVNWNGTYWLATGDNNATSQTVQYSSDASNWTFVDTTFFAAGQANCSAWNGNYWLVGGSNGDSTSIFKSDDTVTWINTGITTFNYVNGLAWNGLLWVAVGSASSGSNIKYSYDSTTWSNATGSGFPLVGNAVTWNGTYFLAVGSGTSGEGCYVYKSYDGRTWTKPSFFTTSPSYPFASSKGYSCAWNGSNWLVTGQLYNSIPPVASPLIVTSTDANSWTTLNPSGFASNVYNIAFSSNTVPSYKQTNLHILPQNIPMNLLSTNQFFATPSSLTVNQTLTINNTVSPYTHGARTGWAKFIGVNCNTPQYVLDVGGEINASQAILSNGTALTSDRRIKTEISSANIEVCYSNLREVPLRTFGFISSFSETKIDKHQIGFIADELSTVFPKSVRLGNVSIDGFSTIYFVNYEQIQMAHFGATQYMANLLENQNSTIVGQNVVLESLQDQVASLSTAVGTLLSR
jgi:hypothetical protein